MSEEETETWQAFSQIALNARLRDAVLFLRGGNAKPQGKNSKELPAAVGLGGGVSATGLSSEDAKTRDEVETNRRRA